MAAAPPAPATANPLGQARLALGRLSSQQKVALIISLAAAVTVLVGGLMWARAGDYRVLFSNVAERDGGAIITALEQLNVPYRFSEGSGAILVPSERVHEARLRLASQGLPRGGSVGFEIMESQKFGISQFAEQVNYQRGLEGELARTIQSIGAVQLARVHLAIPKPSVFVRQEQKPTASVFIQLYAGRNLDGAQIAGITHLVASSVPQLPPGNVSIVDQGGNLLSQVRSRGEAGLDPAQIGYLREIESVVAQRIESILAPLAGPGNARVQVAADVDFSQTEQTAEIFRPNNDPQTTAIRSQQSSESANVSPSAQGVPGALTNQPPVPATAPLTSPPAAAANGQRPTPIAGQIAAAGVNAPINSVGQPLNTRKDSTVNYEVDKTIRHTKSAQGAIKRLSVAVVVNHRREIGRDGKAVSKPLGEPEMKQINDLVREAMGFSSERGDTLSVVNAAFSQIEVELAETPLWKDPDNLALGKDLLRYLVIGAIVAYLLLGVARPLLKLLFAGGAPRAAGTTAAGAAGATAYGAQGQPITIVDQPDEALNVALATYEHKLDKARQVAGENPQVVANIVKDWINPNAS